MVGDLAPLKLKTNNIFSKGFSAQFTLTPLGAGLAKSKPHDYTLYPSPTPWKAGRTADPRKSPSLTPTSYM